MSRKRYKYDRDVIEGGIKKGVKIKHISVKNKWCTVGIHLFIKNHLIPVVRYFKPEEFSRIEETMSDIRPHANKDCVSTLEAILKSGLEHGLTYNAYINEKDSASVFFHKEGKIFTINVKEMT